MKTYQFYMNLTNQGKLNRAFTRIINCLDPTKDGIEKFQEEINKDGRYRPIKEDIRHQLL